MKYTVGTTRHFDKAFKKCIKPDWPLIWEQNDMELTLLLVDTGTHADLF